MSNYGPDSLGCYVDERQSFFHFFCQLLATHHWGLRELERNVVRNPRGEFATMGNNGERVVRPLNFYH